MPNQTRRYVFDIILDELEAYKELILEQKLIVALLITSLILVGLYLEPTPPKKLTMAGYSEMVAVTHKYMEEYGFDLEAVDTDGTLENASLLLAKDNGIDAAFIQGGALDDRTAGQLESLGSISYEPVWTFYRNDLNIKPSTIKELKGLKIGVGPQQGGTRPLIEKLFETEGVKISGDSSFVIDSYINNIKAIEDKQIDAVIIVSPYVDTDVQRLLHNKELSLMDFSMADAYTKIFPFLEKVVVPRGAINPGYIIPTADINVLATTTSLAVSKTFNKDLQILLLMAIREINRNPQFLFFSKRDEFPKYMDPQIPLSAVARRFYDYGVPESMRYFPISIAGFADRYWVILIGVATSLFALSKLNIRLRSIRFHILHRNLYEELLRIEDALSNHERVTPSKKEITSYFHKINEINSHAISEKVPVGSEHEYFELLHAIELMRGKIYRIESIDK